MIDEVVAFWLVLWLLLPVGFWAPGGGVRAVSLLRRHQARAGGLGRSPARPRRLGGGFGVPLDDLVARLCTLLVIALWRAG